MYKASAWAMRETVPRPLCALQAVSEVLEGFISTTSQEMPSQLTSNIKRVH